MAAPLKTPVREIPQWLRTLKSWFYHRCYFPQLGLMRNDAYNATPDVQEAIKRLPKDVYDARVLRINRALILSANKTVLPKEEWMTLDKDIQYLDPYIAMVNAEKQEKKAWLRK